MATPSQEGERCSEHTVSHDAPADPERVLAGAKRVFSVISIAPSVAAVLYHYIETHELHGQASYSTMAEYAEAELQLKTKSAQTKYRIAGRNAFKYFPDLYQAVLERDYARNPIEHGDVPALPLVSHLTELDRAARMLSPAPREQMLRRIRENRLLAVDHKRLKPWRTRSGGAVRSQEVVPLRPREALAELRRIGRGLEQWASDARAVGIEKVRARVDALAEAVELLGDFETGDSADDAGVEPTTTKAGAA